MRSSLALTTLFALAVGLGHLNASAQVAKSTNHPRKDPEGKRGVSPYMEAIIKGENAFAVTKDKDGAKAAFQEAIKLDPDKMLAYYRLGEVELSSGKMDEADKLWETALSKRGPDDVKAKVLFVIADLRERQHKWQAGKDAWAAYAAFLQNNPRAKGFPGTATERIKQADRRMKDEADYAIVRERIAKRQAEKEAEAIENAKKDKLNR